MHPIERLRWLARSDDEPAAALALEAAWTLAELVEAEPAAALTAARRLVERHPANGPMYWACSRVLEASEPSVEANSISRDLCSDATPRHLARELGTSFPINVALLTTRPTDLVRAAFETASASAVRPPSSPEPESWLQLLVVAELTDLRHSMRELAAAGDVRGFLPAEVSEALDAASLVVVEALAGGPDSVLLAPTAAQVVRSAAAAGTGGAGGSDRPRVPVWLVIGEGRVLPSSLLSTAAAASRAAGAARAVSPGLFHSAITPDGVSDVSAALRSSSCPATDWLKG